MPTMSLPNNTAQVLQFLFPAADPRVAWEVHHDPGKPGVRAKVTEIVGWKLPQPQPNEASILAAAASVEFANWLQERTDPAKNLRRQAKQQLDDRSPKSVADRARDKLVYHSVRRLQLKVNEMLAAAKAGAIANVEALPEPRTFSQLVSAVRQSIDAGEGEE